MEDVYLCFYTCGLYSSRREAVWGEETNPDITRPRQVPQTRADHPGQEPVTGARPHHLQGPRVPAAADNTVFSGKASRAFDIHTAPSRRQRIQQGASHQTPHPDFLMGGPTPELSGPSPPLPRGLGQDTNLCLHFPSDVTRQNFHFPRRNDIKINSYIYEVLLISLRKKKKKEDQTQTKAPYFWKVFLLFSPLSGL